MDSTETRRTFRTEMVAGDHLSIDKGRITVTLEHKSGQKARLSVAAGEDISINLVRQKALAVAANGIKNRSG